MKRCKIVAMDKSLAKVARRSVQREGFKLGGVFTVRCIGKDGVEKWHDTAHNLVVDAGLNHLLDVLFAGATQVNPWYVGLTDSTPTVDHEDTMASHAGWALFTNFDEAARQAFVDVRTGQQVDNSASKAVFTISADSSVIGGAFLTSSSTKAGDTGTLLCVVAFTGGDKSADDGDTLEVEYRFTAADDAI